MAPRPVTPAERAAVAQLHAQGRSRAQIGRDLSRPASTIGKIADAQGLTWDRTRTAVATAAKQADNRARRADIVSRCYGRAEHLLSRLEADTFRTLVSSAPGVDDPTNLDFVPPPDEKALAQSISTHLTSAAKLENVDADTGVDQTRSMLGAVMASLRTAWDDSADQ